MADNKRTEFERRLDRLVHLASKTPDEQTEMPSEETIEAYVFGSATEEQQRIVLNALEHSSLFRRELLEIMDDLQPMVEDKNSLTSDDKLTKKSRLGQLYSTSAPSLWCAVKSSISVRLLVPAAAIAAVALLLLWHSDQQLSTWQLVATAVDPGGLISIQLKGASDQKEVRHYATAKEAAFGGFQQLLILGAEGIIVNPQYKSPALIGQEASLHVLLFDDDKNILSDYEFTLLARPLDSDSYVQAWILLLPSRNLMQISMTSDSIQTILPKDSDTQGCLIITMKSDSGWTFAPPASFGFSTNDNR